MIKTPAVDHPGTQQIARYRIAFELGLRADPEAVVRHLELVRVKSSVALVTEDFGGVTLTSLIPERGFRLRPLLKTALTLATALARLHACGILHKDVNPDNVVVDLHGRNLRFIDLGLATRLSRELNTVKGLEQIEGTLAYMSPEQFGRVDSPVDDRADLYSLGVTFYQMAIGRLPFNQQDPAALAHAHMALMPPALSEVRNDLPEVFSAIVARLLQKNQDDRYASAAGVVHDLQRCATELHRSGAVRGFTIGEHDVSPLFRIRERLYGRDAQCEQLLEAFECARRGERTVVTVAGPSGIGKTAFVNHMQRPIVSHDGAFFSGKFDQFKPDQPYLGILQAARAMLRRELSEPAAKLQIRRQALEEAVGIHGRLLTDVMPELEMIIGTQPEVPNIGPHDAARRLHELVVRFLRIFATPQTPLVLFIDDLQWADPASLSLLEALASVRSLGYLMWVLGYRSNGLGAGHPVDATLAALRDQAHTSAAIALGPLDRSDINALIADTLHSTSGDVQSLSDHIHAVAAGNIFFAREFLLALYERGFFQFDETQRIWQWNPHRLAGQTIPDNVVDLLTDRLTELPENSLDLLNTASCVGSEFDLRSVASVHELQQRDAAVGLAPAVSRGLIVSLGIEHDVLAALGDWDLKEDHGSSIGVARYRFQHDQVRETVHARLSSRRRVERHLHIGRLLARSLPKDELDSRAVEVFNHLAYGSELVTNEQERCSYASLGLVAGRAAQRGLAFETARSQLTVAANFLPDRAWAVEYETTLGIYLTLAECVFALGDAEEFDALASRILEHVKGPVDAARVHGLRIRVLATENRYAEAVDICVRIAKTLGVSLPRKPRLAHVLLGVVQVLWAQGWRDPCEFEKLPEATDSYTNAAISLLCEGTNAAYFAEPNLLPLIGITSTRLSLRHGVTPRSAYGFATWALVLCAVLGRINNGYGFGMLALNIGRRYGGVDEARARFVVSTFVRHWKEPLADVAQRLYQNWAFNRDAGDEETAVYCGGVLLYTDFLAGGSVDGDRRHDDVVQYIAASNKPHVKDCLLAWVQLLELLRAAELPEELSGRWFDLRERLPEFERTRNGVQIAISLIAAGILDHLAGRYERAEHRFAAAAGWEGNIVGQALVPGLAFFRARNAYRLYAVGPRHRGVLRIARRQTARIRKWAPFAPCNFGYRLLLLDAEDQLARGHAAAAVLSLHRAADQAASGAVLYGALAERRLGEILDALGYSTQAQLAESRACSLFEAWGSNALADRNSPNTTAAPTSRAEISGATQTITANITGMDLQSLLDAVRTISGEIDRNALLDRLMSTLMQTANADRGLLILIDTEGTATVEVDARAGAEVRHVGASLDDFHDVARPVVDFALRAGELLVIDDAMANELVADSPYVRQTRVRAILATCIAVQGRVLGLIYLENHLAKGAFTSGRAAITEALGSQAGIALENSHLYSEVQDALASQTLLTAAHRRFVPKEILAGLGYNSIADVDLGEAFDRDMNVLLADLRAFTTLSMKLGAQRTIEMINRYLAHVQPGIVAHHGFVGEYRGDSVLALFPRDADDAIHGAIAMCQGLEGYNRERGGFPELRFGIGIYSGLVTLGMIGDTDHIAIGVMGDTVNTASRIEALTKYYGATVLLSGATRSRLVVGQRFAFRFLGDVEVPGRPEVLELFDCIDSYPEETRDKILLARDDFDRAVRYYIEGRWIDAATIFTDLSRACPADRVSEGFQRRCQLRARHGTPWDGIERPAKALA